jgi:hypothetical protein
MGKRKKRRKGKLAGGAKEPERERERGRRARAGEQGGARPGVAARPCGEEGEERGVENGPLGKGPAQEGGGGKGQAGLLLVWLLFSFSFPFSISFPDFQLESI